MIYLIERALFYYFLMREIHETDGDFWKFVASRFGLKNKDIKDYGQVISASVLDELSSVGDIKMYQNYLGGFLCSKEEFGKSQAERDAIEAKALALQKVSELFGENSLKSGRLNLISRHYGNDGCAAVLYALQVAYHNKGTDCRKFVENILMRELMQNNNSDAGIVLLKLKKSDGKEILSTLARTPDMLLRTDVVKMLGKQYSIELDKTVFNERPAMGFDGGVL